MVKKNMDTTNAVLTLPLSSSRLLERLARRLGNQSLLGGIIRRVTDCARINRVIVAAYAADHEAIPTDLIPPDVPVVWTRSGREIDAWDLVLREFPADGVIHVAVDNPFVDPVFIDRLVTTAQNQKECDYVGYCLRDGQPMVRSIIRILAEWGRYGALEQAVREIRNLPGRQGIMQYLCQHPERYALRFVPLPEDIDPRQLRFHIDCDDDWEKAEAIFDALGADGFDWPRGGALIPSEAASETATDNHRTL